MSNQPLNICFFLLGYPGAKGQDGSVHLMFDQARALSRAGHNVTCVSFHREEETRKVGYSTAKKLCTQEGIKFLCLDKDISTPTFLIKYIAKGYFALRWLRYHAPLFDIIHYPSLEGIGHFFSMAKKQGLCLENTRLCVHMVGTTEDLFHQNKLFPERVRYMSLNFMERESIARADNIVEYSSRQKIENINQHTHFIPPFVLDVEPNKIKPSKINEIIFYGELSPRRGVEVFLEAISNIPKNIAISFLGNTFSYLERPSHNQRVEIQTLIKRITKKKNVAVNFLLNKSPEEARAYISQKGKLVILCGEHIRTGYPIAELLALNNPFITRSNEGLSFVAAIDRKRISFSKSNLSDVIKKTIEKTPIPPKPSSQILSAQKKWLALHTSWSKTTTHAKTTLNKNLPKVSVCLTHYNRPDFLREAIQSLIEQDYPNFEVLLVDDGSTFDGANKFLSSLKKDFKKRGWKVFCKKNNYQGAALNFAARRANGEYLLLMDDDNVAKPHEISTFIKVALNTKADVLTCFSSIFKDVVGKTDDDMETMVFIGPCISIGAMQNGYGDTNALVKKDVYLKLGGFPEDYGIGHMDWSFFARAALAGYHLEVVAQPLFAYRGTYGRVCNSTKTRFYENMMLVLRPYLETLPPYMKDLILYTTSTDKFYEQRCPFPWAL